MKNDTGAELLAVDPASRSIDDRDCCGDTFAGVDRSKIGEVNGTSTVAEPMEAAAVDAPIERTAYSGLVGGGASGVGGPEVADVHARQRKAVQRSGSHRMETSGVRFSLAPRRTPGHGPGVVASSGSRVGVRRKASSAMAMVWSMSASV